MEGLRFTELSGMFTISPAFALFIPTCARFFVSFACKIIRHCICGYPFCRPESSVQIDSDERVTLQ